MASSADNMVRDAIKAYHNGSVEEARSLLLQAVEVDEANEQAWLWLSAVVESDHDRQTCLENVLTINPNNEKAQQGLRILKDRANTGGPPTRRQQMEAAPAEDDDPFANVSFTGPGSSADAPVSPFSSDDEEEELPDVAWGSLETSSASARPVVPEPSKDQYEDWISNLNIGGNNAEEFFGDNVEEIAGQTSDLGYNAAPFIGSDDVFSDEEPFELDENIFGLDDEVFQAGGDLGAGGSPFSADIDSEFPDEPSEAPAEPAPAAPASTTPPLTSPVPQASPMSPVPARPSQAVDRAEGFGILDDDLGFDFDDTSVESLDPEEYFAYIPPEIKASRLPGTNERYAPAMIFGLLLLLGLNIGAIFLVFMRLNGA